MKTNKTIITILSIVLFLSACQSETDREKQGILKQILEIANQYNTFVENGKLTGGNVFKEYRPTLEKIIELNEKYYELSKPILISYSNDINEKSSRELQLEYQNWILQELKTGSKVTLHADYNSDIEILIGDSYVAMKKWKSILATAKVLDPVIPADEFSVPDFAVEIIQNIEGNNTKINFSTDMIFSGSGGPNFSPITYETDSTYYTIDSHSRQLVGIAPIIRPAAGEGLPLKDLETLAREIIAKFSPDIRLNQLTFDHKSKAGIHFFQWTDTDSKFPNGTHPFIEITLTGKGELFRYINTVILSE